MGVLEGGDPFELIEFDGVPYFFVEGEWRLGGVGPLKLYDGTTCPTPLESARTSTETGLQFLGEVMLVGTLTRHYAAPSSGDHETWEIWIDRRGQLVQTYWMRKGTAELRSVYSEVGEPNVITPPVLAAIPPEMCSNGVVVPEPSANPGLVGDCEILLEVKVVLAGVDGLNWSADTPISSWEGVIVSGAPSRIRSLRQASPATGRNIPPELGSLAELETLDLRHSLLEGAIPPELGRLTNLRELHLGNNRLTGTIPSALGALSNLRRLDLGKNRLTGTIPSALGGLSNLTALSLGRNQLTGAIPPELGGPLQPGGAGAQQQSTDGGDSARTGRPVRLGAP